MNIEKIQNQLRLVILLFYSGVLLCAGWPWPVSAQTNTKEVKALLFRDASLAMRAAQDAKADILAPKSFTDGIELYRKAEVDFEREKNLEEIRKNLRSATALFIKAANAIKIATVVLGSAIQARADAMSSEAPRFAIEKFREAERKFGDAARALEDGDSKKARERADEAEKLHREAELLAIKANYLNEAYALLKEAEKMKAKDVAPKTFLNAQELIAEAEKELRENRYDTDVARVLARQAKQQAKHAIFLTTKIKSIKAQKLTSEDLLLEAERPLENIAAAMELAIGFDAGLEKPAAEIVAKVTNYQEAIAKLTSNAYDDGQQIALLQGRKNELEKWNGDLQNRVADLEKQLGGVEKEKSLLAREKSQLADRLNAQARIREKYAEIEKYFSRDEALFIREGDNVIMRLIGLSFPVGKATIDAKYHDFFAKVYKAITAFPKAAIVVEGHTDSFGSDASNLKLSVDRAEAVKKYLVEQLNLYPDRIEALGYGESKPIATNETEAGRARNRRIEIIIQPQLDMMY